MTEECYSCRSNSGEERLSPGPTIYAGRYWYVEHAYPSKITGWLVFVLKRHAEALHDLSRAEFLELAELQATAATILRIETGCEKEYMACFAELPGFNHIHFHFVAKPGDLPASLHGTAIFSLIKRDQPQPLAPNTIAEFCERLRARFTEQIELNS